MFIELCPDFDVEYYKSFNGELNDELNKMTDNQLRRNYYFYNNFTENKFVDVNILDYRGLNIKIRVNLFQNHEFS